MAVWFAPGPRTLPIELKYPFACRNSGRSGHRSGRGRLPCQQHIEEPSWRLCDRRRVDGCFLAVTVHRADDDQRPQLRTGCSPAAHGPPVASSSWSQRATARLALAVKSQTNGDKMKVAHP
jgi:hypothetical protein